MEEIVINRSFTSIVTSGEAFSDVFNTEEYFTPYKRSKLMSTASFQNKLNGVLRLDGNDILPNNTRFMKTLKGGDKLVVIEEPPCVRSIHVEFDMDSTIEKLKTTGKLEEYGYENWLKQNEKPYRFHLAFPYIVYILYISSDLCVSVIKVYYRIHPITSFSDYLFLTNLLNVDSSQSMCLGDYPNNAKIRTLVDSINYTLERFWLNSFNKDYIYNYQKYQYIPNICDFLTWEYHTRKDPMFIYNVEWISSKIKLGNVIDDFSRYNHDGIERNQWINFDTILDVFNKPVPTRSTEDDRDSKIIWNNVVESMIIKDSTIAVGDMIEIGGKECYINAFNGIRQNGICRVPTSIEVEDIDNNIMTVELTPTLYTSLGEQICNSKFLSSVEVNGETIKIGDILVLSYPNKSYRKVSKIRKARDGVIEIQFNKNDYYLISKILFEKFDVTNIVVNGVKIEKDKEYFIGTDRYARAPLMISKIGKFVQIRDNSSGKLFMRFKTIYNDHFHVPLSLSFDSQSPDEEHEIFEPTNVERPKVFRLFNFLVTTHNITYGIVKGRGILSSGRTDDLKYSCNRAKQEIISENSINITSYDIDINLSVGEQVVIADWANPVEMLKIRTIESFTVDKDNKLFVNTLFKDQKRSDNYVDFQNGVIEMGKIRKVVTEFGGLRSGDKIRAEIPRLTNFPKKDVNTIVAFLVDTGTKYPLMLCSNCCTLWAAPEVLEQFIVYRRGTRDWGRYQNAPIELNKIRFQSGDVIYADGCYFIAHYMEGHSNKLLVTDLINRKGFEYERFIDCTTICDEANRVGIITPRYPITQRRESAYEKRCFPNLHGGYVEHSSSILMFKEVWDHV